MVTRETGFIFAWAVLAIVALPLVACGDSKRADGARGNDSGGSGGSSGSTGSGGSGASGGSTGGSRGGSNGVGGATGGSAATAGSGGDAGTAGAGGTGDSGGGGAGGEEESASFHWIEATEGQRERAASATKPVVLRTFALPPYDASVLIGTSEIVIGQLEEVYNEGFWWTEATGTIALGGFPGANPNINFSTLSQPRAISADGSVVVGAAMTSQNGSAPFRWTRTDGMEAIAEEGVADAVSEDGSVVLGVQGARVFRWTRALGAVTIVEPLAGDDAIEVLALSADGATALGKSYRADESAARLFVWTEGAGTRAVENLPGHTNCPVVLAAVSRSYGFVAAGSCYDETQYELFVWAGQDTLMALGPTDALGGYELAEPAAVSADGSVAVGTSAGMDRIETRTYRWTEADGFELIELPEGFTSSGAAGMSDDGSVVVGGMDGIARRAFLWSEGAGAVVLLPLEGHDVSDRAVVSADGSIAAGRSYRFGTANEIVDSTAVYWRADGVAHRIADELAAEGIDLGGGVLEHAVAAHAQLGFFGIGSKDEVSNQLAWRASLP